MSSLVSSIEIETVETLETEKAVTLLFLDLTNILCSAKALGWWIDLRKLISRLSRTFDCKGLFAFTSSNNNSKFVEALYNMGFIVFQKPFDSDALMGFKISELIRLYGVKTVIIGTHDGDFRGVGDELEQSNIDIYFLGFRNEFSTLLFEDLDILVTR
jgi:uncharacterized LabA/DUF88 family protein